MEIFDVRNTLIPFSLLQISNLFKQLKVGEAIEIIGGDDSVAADLKRILAGTSFDLRVIRQSESRQGDLHLRLLKR